MFLLLEHIFLLSHFVLLYMFVVSISQAAGLWLLFLLLSAPWWMSLVQVLIQASWWEPLVPVHWLIELGFVALLGRAMSSGMFRDICALRTTLGSLSLMGEAVFPPCLLFSLRYPSTGACKLSGRARYQGPNGDILESLHR